MQGKEREMEELFTVIKTKMLPFRSALIPFSSPSHIWGVGIPMYTLYTAGTFID